MPWAPAFMRRAPPTVPGTPMSPSIPPRSFLAQKVIMRPRSAAASTCARLPSITSRFEPPPRNLCGIWFVSRRFRSSGRLSCFLTRSKSVVPPMRSEVRSARAAPCCGSTWISSSLATILGSRMCMRGRMLRSQQNHEFIARPADIARADGEDCVPGTRLFQQVFDAFLHGAKIVDVLVTGLANGSRKRFTCYARDGRFAGRIDIKQNKDVCLIERAAELIPEVLGTRVAMRLKEHEQAIELAAAGRFERGANLGRVMAVIIDNCNVIDYALDVKAASHTGKLHEAFADQVSRNV